MSKFVKVVVEGGRKFRGFAYDIGSAVKTSCGGYGYSSWTSCSIKLWSPSEGFVYCNPSYMRVVECDPEEVKADFAKYCEVAIGDTIKWCRSKSENKPEAEVIRFARNIIAKHNPDLLSIFDQAHPTSVPETAEKTPEDEIVSTLRWAMGLKTKSGYFRGRFCRGGNPYPTEKVIAIAEKALTTKGLASREDFGQIFAKALVVVGLRAS